MSMVRLIFLGALELIGAAVSAAPGVNPGADLMTAFVERPPAPEFVLTDTRGRQHRLSDFRGGVVVVNFWAIWCPPCRAEMPSLQRAWERLRPHGIVVLAIDVGESSKRVADFAAGLSLDFPLLLDEQAEVFGKWSVPGLPTTFVVDQQGRLAYRANGVRDWDDPALLEMILDLDD